jgi:hypothetical protein
VKAECGALTVWHHAAYARRRFVRVGFDGTRPKMVRIAAKVQKALAERPKAAC